MNTQWFIQVFPVILIVSLLFFLIGALLGMILWGGRKRQALELEAETKKLNNENQDLNKEYNRLNKSIS